MHLYLTKRSHLNSSYVNNDGKVLYKVETPYRLVGLASTIKSALPGDIGAPGPNRMSETSPHDQTSDNDVEGDVEYDVVPNDDDENDIEHEETELQVRFAHLAGVKFNRITSSVIRFRGEEYETRKFFTRKEWHGRHRAFIGPDGLEYLWILGRRVPELVRRDEARTPVARFHRRRLFGKARRAPESLEIFSEGMHMVDFILVTFVYIQKIRNDKERAG
ncbi:hypothetical protein F5887DRAFT_912733 [Amanita rubescens]|nr:hypothetical protein F5887DRAFT_912733 [Amanita rubescens]